MPSPFPGMDPFIEDQGYWPDFHASIIPYCRDALNLALPRSYEARLGEHVRLIELSARETRDRLPDVTVHTREDRPIRSRPVAPSSSVSVLEPVTIALPKIKADVRDVWIEILRRPDRALVTVIEVLSPSNKSSEGHWDYLEKRRSLTKRNVHLVEIDLLLRGERLPISEELPPGDFYAFVSRAERRPDSEVYGWSIRRPLPQVSIPLLEPDPDVPLDLAAVFATAYERGVYDRSLDYAAKLALPLDAEDKSWAENLARTALA